MTGQPKKKLKEVEELADNCFTVALNACAIIPQHYLDRHRKPDPRDKIGLKWRSVYKGSMLIHVVSEQLENLLRAKAGLEPRPSRFDEARQRSEADKGDLEQQFEQESEQLRGGDLSVLKLPR